MIYNMAEKYEQSSPSLEGEEILAGPRGEGRYHDTDVFGHEEDHDVRCSPSLLASKHCISFNVERNCGLLRSFSSKSQRYPLLTRHLFEDPIQDSIMGTRRRAHDR